MSCYVVGRKWAQQQKLSPAAAGRSNKVPVPLRGLSGLLNFIKLFVLSLLVRLAASVLPDRVSSVADQLRIIREGVGRVAVGRRAGSSVRPCEQSCVKSSSLTIHQCKAATLCAIVTAVQGPASLSALAS